MKEEIIQNESSYNEVDDGRRVHFPFYWNLSEIRNTHTHKNKTKQIRRYQIKDDAIEIVVWWGSSYGVI